MGLEAAVPVVLPKLPTSSGEEKATALSTPFVV
jgi:hypothetical protein